MKLPGLVTVYEGGHVYRDEAPDELVDQDAIKAAAKRLRASAKKCTSDEDMRKDYEARAKDMEAAILPEPKGSTKKPEK